MKSYLKLDIPFFKSIEIRNLVFDLNGTLAKDGLLLDGVEDRLKELAKIFDIYILTADTNNTIASLSYLNEFDIKTARLESSRGDIQKLRFIEELGPYYCATFGNGGNDVLMLKNACLGACIIGLEGASFDAIEASDIIFFDINDALDAFLKPTRLIASLRR